VAPLPDGSGGDIVIPKRMVAARAGAAQTPHHESTLMKFMNRHQVAPTRADTISPCLPPPTCR
jgi:hypothetical protein